MSQCQLSAKGLNLEPFIDFINKVINCGNDHLEILDDDGFIFYNQDLQNLLYSIHIGTDYNKSMCIKHKNKKLYIEAKRKSNDY